MLELGTMEFGSDIAETENKNMAFAEERKNSFQTFDMRKSMYEKQGLPKGEVLRKLLNEQHILFRIVDEIPTLEKEQGN